jgi:tetratricopeptide (TPR) repeat protein
MDVCNQIAIVNQGREKSEEALDFLQQAHAYYKLENPNVDNAQGPELISEKWLKGKRTSLEANLTQTYFYYAQVYSKLGRADEGIEYSCKTMQR